MIEARPRSSLSFVPVNTTLKGGKAHCSHPSAGIRNLDSPLVVVNRLVRRWRTASGHVHHRSSKNPRLPPRPLSAGPNNRPVSMSHALLSAHADRVLIGVWIPMLCPIHVFRSGPPRSPRSSSRSRCTPPSPSARCGGARSDAQPFPGVAGGEGGRVLPAHRPPSSQLALHLTDPPHPTPAVLCALFSAHASLDADWCPRPMSMMVIVITDQPSTRSWSHQHTFHGGGKKGGKEEGFPAFGGVAGPRCTRTVSLHL